MNNLPNDGARLRFETRQPAVDLALLIEHLLSALAAEDPKPSADNPKQRPFIYFDSEARRLKLCTSGVLRRLLFSPNFRPAFQMTPEQSEGSLIVDFEAPKPGTTAKLGGRLTEDNRTRLPALLDQFIEQLDKLLPQDQELAQLLLPDAEAQLRRLATQIKVPFPGQIQSAQVQRVSFQDASGAGSSAVMAKVVSALEEIQAEKIFANLTEAIATHLYDEGNEDGAEEAEELLKEERQRENSAVNRFLAFLENEALARVRLDISRAIMEEIAKLAAKISQPNKFQLVQYIEGIAGAVNLIKQEGFAVELDQFGVGCQFTLEEYIQQAQFFKCLPIWPEAKTQIFEGKSRNETGAWTQREISYRFRINGNNPETGKSAFISRLNRLEDRLKSALEPNEFVSQSLIKQALAELFFLEMVIPDSPVSVEEDCPRFNPEDYRARFQLRLTTLTGVSASELKEQIGVWREELAQRESFLKEIVTALLTILRQKDRQLLEQIQTRSARKFIGVRRSIMDWDRLLGGTPPFLRGSGQSPQAEQIEWFKHIAIADQPTGSFLFSVEIKTRLTGHNLVEGKTGPQTLQAQRVFTPQLLQIVWIPHEFKAHPIPKKTGAASRPSPPTYRVSSLINDPSLKPSPRQWGLNAFVQVEYEADLLKRTFKQNNQSDWEHKSQEQYHAASVAAFGTLVYITLWQIIQRLKKLSSEEFTAIVLRMQSRREREEEIESKGEQYVYSAAQSIEMLLNQDISLRMQGFTLENLKKNTDYVKKGSFRAVLSAFPLRLSLPRPPALDRVGLIAYASRPCDEQPGRPAAENLNLLTVKSYSAQVIQEPFNGYEIKTERMDLDILPAGDFVSQQRLLKEEIYSLHQQGCRHILFISHSYGARTLNRTAEGNYYLLQTSFLEDIFQTFADLTLYPLIRDEFPATRIRKRKEIGFEINRAEDHAQFLRYPVRETVKDLIPVYTFATLHAVGNDDQRPQSGFCCYFLVSDHQVSNIAWTERARRHLLDGDNSSPIHPCLISLLRGVHFLEAEKLGTDILAPVLNPYAWITPTTKAAAGEVPILVNQRRRGKTLLSYPALLGHVSAVLHRPSP